MTSFRFLQLALFILCLLLASALFPNAFLMRSLLALAFLNTLFVALSAAGIGSRLRGALLIIWAAGTLCTVFGELSVTDRLARPAALAGQAAYLFLIISGIAATFRYVITARRATLDTVFAALVAYLLIGVGFALLYTMLQMMDPQSFNVAGRPGTDGYAELSSLMLYFSFVTIATLGYGDIIPQLPLPQILSALEAVIGQFYIAVVIAWLVSRYAAERDRASG